MDINELFKNKVKQSYQPKRTYDVRITLNKNGNGGYVIRFGFLNKAIDAIGGKEFAQVSDICTCCDKIYFRFFDEKEYLDVYKVSRQQNGKAMYIQVSVTDKEEKIYRRDWIQDTFKLHFDDAYKLYYIEKVRD